MVALRQLEPQRRENVISRLPLLFPPSFLVVRRRVEALLKVPYNLSGGRMGVDAPESPLIPTPSTSSNHPLTLDAIPISVSSRCHLPFGPFLLNVQSPPSNHPLAPSIVHSAALFQLVL